MPRNGTGQYAAPASTWNPGVNGVTALTADYNAQLDDIEAALSQSVSADGQTPLTGNLQAGNNKITGLAPGTANTDSATVAQIPKATGQCRLLKTGANLVLTPYNGNQITINGALQTIPAAGVSLAPGAFTPGTTYYIYAYMVTTVLTLEASTTGHATDSTTGVEIKAGDGTRTLVGMARPITGPLWQDTLAQRFVVSWFNPRPISTSNVFTTTRSTTSAIVVEVNAEIRNEFLTWADRAGTFSANGVASVNAAVGFGGMVVGLDGAGQNGGSQFLSPNSGNGIGAAAYAALLMTEGYHYVTLMAYVAGGNTVSFTGTGTIVVTTVQGAIQG